MKKVKVAWAREGSASFQVEDVDIPQLRTYTFNGPLIIVDAGNRRFVMNPDQVKAIIIDDDA